MNKNHACTWLLILLLANTEMTFSLQMSARLPGDVTVGGLFQIYDNTNNQCSQNVDIMSVRNFEAAKWMLTKLNEMDFIPGIKIGIEAYYTCNVPGLAIKHATHFMNKAVTDGTNSSTQPIIGILGPENSGEAEETSRYITSMTESHQLLQVLFSATGSDLSNDDKYRNILRVIPSDQKQTKVIVDLMKVLHWNYIAVIYENSMYGRGGLQGLQNLASTESICITKILPIELGSSNAVSISELQRLMNSIVLNVESPITGVVVFASSATIKSLLLITQNLYSSMEFRLSMIFSESIALDKTILEQNSISKGAYVSSPPQIYLPEFVIHWENILTNKSVFLQEASSNPWLYDVFKSYKACSPDTSSCSMLSLDEARSKFETNIFESYSVLSISIFAMLLKSIHFEECKGNGGICLQLRAILHQKKSELLVKSRTQMKVDSSNFPLNFFPNFSLSLEGNSDVAIIGDIPEYEVYHYRRCISLPGKFCLERVASFANSSLTVEEDLLRDYYQNENGLSWPNINRAQCSKGKSCVSCLKKDIANEIYIREGDLYIVGIMPVFDKGSDPLSCGEVRMENGWELTEGIAFAVDMVNERNGVYSGLFRTQNIGYIIINSCNQPLLIKSKLIKLLQEGVDISNGTQIKDVSKKILGFVAELGSSVSIATAEVLQEFNFIQTAYGSTANSLSARNLYKYFTRLCTPDIYQAVVMMKVVSDLKSDYVQILYSEGTYGEGGREAIHIEAKKLDICVANEIKVKEGKYTKILDDLRKTPYAKIVILFLKSHVVGNVIQYLYDVELIDDGEFLLIGSEAFGTRTEIIHNRRKLEGTISLSLELEGSSRPIQNYIFEKLQKNQFTNPWTRMYFEKKDTCFLPSSFDKSSRKECDGHFSPYNESNFQQDIWTPFVINAALALLNGTNEAMKQLCGVGATEICTEFRIQPHKVWNHVVKQHLVLNEVPTRIFDDNGDGNVGYVINQVQRNTSNMHKLEYKMIGRYSLDGKGYFLQKSSLIDPFNVLPSNCPNPRECQICKQQLDSVTTDKTTDRCTCGGCQQMPTQIECCCCKQFQACQDLPESETGSIDCITLHEGFRVNCLNMHVLRLAFYDYLDTAGHIGDEEPIHDLDKTPQVIGLSVTVAVAILVILILAVYIIRIKSCAYMHRKEEAKEREMNHYDKTTDLYLDVISK